MTQVVEDKPLLFQSHLKSDDQGPILLTAKPALVLGHRQVILSM